MKFTARILLLASLTATFAVATCNQPGKFCHIIIVIQENRTPDNLFGANLTFENGVDLAGGGYGFVAVGQPVQITREYFQNTPRDLNGCVPRDSSQKCINPGHEHPDWTTDYDAGNMDGFCHQYTNSGQCPSYSYVPQSDAQPYFDIATNYGFANYMFQSNEGPSYEAHQFLFSGTSTGVSPGQTNSQYFVSSLPNSDVNGNVGCPYIGTDFPNWVNTNGAPLGPLLSSECYPHDTLVTNSGGDKGVSWGYYTPSVPAIWDAPAALSEVCQQVTNNSCTGTEWTTHVHVADEGGYSDAPIFDDLKNCTLPAISWVIPDKRYSDHATEDNTGLGPSFVGDIVDAVGGGMSGSTWNPPSTNNALYWKQQPTAIFILWDDWGGWFDHVAPWAVYRDSGGTQCLFGDAPNGWGCGYTSGFRVPLLVVSPYTLAGTISGECGVTGYPNCPNPGTNNVYVHDFGSILAFTEKNFGLNFIDQSGDLGYADYNAPDWSSDHSSHVPLSDFFGSTYYNFASINTSEPYTCFQNFGTCTNTTYVPDGPDGDDGD